jgi:hypothetical protein
MMDLRHSPTARELERTLFAALTVYRYGIGLAGVHSTASMLVIGSRF